MEAEGDPGGGGSSARGGEMEVVAKVKGEGDVLHWFMDGNS